jgi:hypothetical protein
MERISTVDQKQPGLISKTPEEIEGMSFEEMKALFDNNDQILCNLITDKNIPYFGLHGTSKKGLEFHQTTQGEGKLQFDVATFFDKNINKRVLLNSLYACADKTQSYATYSSGDFALYNGEGIQVVSLEEENADSNYAMYGSIPMDGHHSYYEAVYPAQSEEESVIAERGVISLDKTSFNRITKTLTDRDLAGYLKLYIDHASFYEEERKKDKPRESKEGPPYGPVHTEKFIFVANKLAGIRILLYQKIVEESLKSLGVI